MSILCWMMGTTTWLISIYNIYYTCFTYKWQHRSHNCLTSYTHLQVRPAMVVLGTTPSEFPDLVRCKSSQAYNLLLKSARPVLQHGTEAEAAWQSYKNVWVDSSRGREPGSAMWGAAVVTASQQTCLGALSIGGRVLVIYLMGLAAWLLELRI